jgi:hypothetical protein
MPDAAASAALAQLRGLAARYRAELVEREPDRLRA